jgi:hypothetical protein
MEGYTFFGCFQPVNIRQPQEEHEAVRIESDVIVLARLRAETLQ